MSSTTFLAPAASLGLSTKAFFEAVRTQLLAGARAVTFYGQPAADPADLTLTMVLEVAGRLQVLRTDVDRVVNEINTIVEDAKNDQILSSYVSPQRLSPSTMAKLL